MTARIREILLNYPEGNSIAKELVQNADDAGARTISFCLDERHHGTESLLAASLQPLQGPALLVHNDSTFSEGDFESISNIGASIKRAQDGKTGDVIALSGWPVIWRVPGCVWSCVGNKKSSRNIWQCSINHEPRIGSSFQRAL